MRRSCSCTRTASTSLPLDQKLLIWHLYQAALAGRDIYYDQRYAHNLEMRDVLEEILTHPAGIDPATLAEIQRYTKLFWLNTGPVQQPDRAQVRAQVHARRPSPPPRKTAAKNGATISAAGGRVARRDAGAAAAAVLRRRRRPDRHEQDARGQARTS